MADLDCCMTILDLVSIDPHAGARQGQPMQTKRTRPAHAPAPPGKPAFLSTQITEARRYFLNLAPSRTRGLEVVCGGVERCRGDYEIRRSGFPFMAVEFVAEGLGTLRLAGRNYPLRPGMAFAYARGVSHTICNQPRSPMLKYYLDFVGDEGERLLKQSPLGHWQAVQVSNLGEILDILEGLQRNGEAPGAHRAEVCAHLAALLILKISENTIPLGAEESRAFPTYQRVREHLERNYLALKTVEEVAAACHVNVSYLCRLFQRFHHSSPYQFLLRLKMNQAAALLLDRGLQVKEVAADLRFSDPYAFSRAFKNVYGLSPEAFVKQGQRRGTQPK
jgi:AraC-like DNA-binding protein